MTQDKLEWDLFRSIKRMKMLCSIAYKPKTVKQITKEVDTHRQTVYNEMGKLMDRGYVKTKKAVGKDNDAVKEYKLDVTMDIQELLKQIDKRTE